MWVPARCRHGQDLPRHRPSPQPDHRSGHGLADAVGVRLMRQGHSVGEGYGHRQRLTPRRARGPGRSHMCIWRTTGRSTWSRASSPSGSGDREVLASRSDIRIGREDGHCRWMKPAWAKPPAAQPHGISDARTRRRPRGRPRSAAPRGRRPGGVGGPATCRRRRHGPVRRSATSPSARPAARPPGRRWHPSDRPWARTATPVRAASRRAWPAAAAPVASAW